MVKARDNRFAHLCQDVTRQLRKHFDRRAVRFGMTRAQWRALKTTRHYEGLSQAELADYLDMEPIPVGRVIDRLEKTGFIERRADPGDRRRWRLYLKPKAHAVVDEMEVIAAELRDEALRDIPRADLDALMRALTQMKENLVALDATANEERGTS